MEIEYVRLLTKEEYSDFVKKQNEKYIEKKEIGIKWVHENIEKIIMAVRRVDMRARLEQTKKRKEIINKGGEWMQEKLSRNKVYIASNWLNFVRTEINAPSYVKNKLMFETLMEYGDYDLRLKYGFTETSKSYSGYSKAKINSIKDELKFLEIIKSKYEKVVYQQGILYKIKNEKQKFCFPDIVASNKNSVHVFEVKCHNCYFEDSQLNLYVDLIKKILSNHNDLRKVKGFFLEGESVNFNPIEL
jgi:hypothetical protein